MTRARLAVLALAFTVAGCSAPAPSAAPAPSPAVALPDAAWQHQRLLIRVSRAEWGDDTRVAALAAQVHQESSWRGDAKSRYAEGWAQFRPTTADWAAKTFAKDLGPAAPHDASWALPAMARYMRWIEDRVPRMAPYCDRWAAVLAGYNGGPGWVARDRALCEAATGCDPSRWWGHVELHSDRAEWAFRENRGYPRRILRTLLPRYLEAGYRGQAICT